jgi:hypothetical protein
MRLSARTLRLRVPSDISMPLEVYSTERPYITLGPRGWKCSGSGGSAGNTWYIYPKRLSDNVPVIAEFDYGNGSGGGVSAVTSMGEPLFPTLRLLQPDLTPWYSAPHPDPWPGEYTWAHGNHAIAFADPPGVMGSGGIVSRRDPTEGIVMEVPPFITWAGGRAAAAVPNLSGIAVTLPPSDDAVAQLILAEWYRTR